MAKTTLVLRFELLQTEVRQQRHLIHALMEQIGQQQGVLDLQFRRFADIQAELDLVKATVRLFAPTFAAPLIGRGPGTPWGSSPRAGGLEKFRHRGTEAPRKSE